LPAKTVRWQKCREWKNTPYLFIKDRFFSYKEQNQKWRDSNRNSFAVDKIWAFSFAADKPCES
jgi:hypothetical protein